MSRARRPTTTILLLGAAVLIGAGSRSAQEDTPGVAIPRPELQCAPSEAGGYLIVDSGGSQADGPETPREAFESFFAARRGSVAGCVPAGASATLAYYVRRVERGRIDAVVSVGRYGDAWVVSHVNTCT